MDWRPYAMFNPEPDITAFELATIIMHTELSYIRKDGWDKIPEEMRRHFIRKEEV